jgi:hypothetical protein
MWTEACTTTDGKYDFASFEATSADLTCAAFFFAMRSCEYLTVNNRGKTKLLTIGNIVFRRANIRRSVISPLDKNFDRDVRFVTITFPDQKNGHKKESRTQSRTDHHIMCPPRLWGRIIRRILHYNPNAGPDTPVNTWFEPSADEQENPKPRFVHQKDIINILRKSCASGGGREVFGYDPPDIGTHSIRSGAAMALFLANQSIIKIMILGRWCSAAFMRYIRSQVMEWTAGLSQAMLTCQDFRHACLTGSSEPVGLNPSIQCNVDVAIDSPEETTFSGSVAHADFCQINLEM